MEALTNFVGFFNSRGNVMTKWYGMLTIDNINEVVTQIKEVIDGKKYTFVAVNMYGNENNPGRLVSDVDVRTSQEVRHDKAKNGQTFTVWFDDESPHPRFAGFNVSDSYGVWGLSTRTNSHDYDYEFKNPYIVIDHDKISISHRAPAGHILYWIIAVEAQP